MSREALALLRGGVASLLMAYLDRLPLRDPEVEVDRTTGSTTITTRGEDGPISRFRVAVDELDLDERGNEPPVPTWLAWEDVWSALDRAGVERVRAERVMADLIEHREFPCPLDPPTTS